MSRPVKQPPSASTSPRFCNPGTFMRMPALQTSEGLDFVILGVPFDTGSSYRTGARFGPTAIRNISVMIKPNNVQMQVNVFDTLQGADGGDISIIPGYTEASFEAIEQHMDPFVQAGIVPICLGFSHIA